MSLLLKFIVVAVLLLMMNFASMAIGAALVVKKMKPSLQLSDDELRLLYYRLNMNSRSIKEYYAGRSFYTIVEALEDTYGTALFDKVDELAAKRDIKLFENPPYKPHAHASQTQ